MTKRADRNPDLQSLEEMASDYLAFVQKNQKTLRRWVATPWETLAGTIDPLNAAGSLARGARELALSPRKLLQANLSLWRQHAALWRHAASRLVGRDSEPVARPDPGDRRFAAPEWDQNPVYDLIRQSYLITSRWLVQTMSDIDNLSEADAQKVRFYTRQFADALAPSNFALTNPAVLKATVDSGGQNLIRGMQNLIRDLRAGKGQLRITMTDESAYEVGRNVATAPGKIIYQNQILQLIQYAPSTEEVYKRPLLIVPPWINKFYILDLQPENSFIRYAVDRGYTVFVVSWANPDASFADKTMDDYLRDGILASLDAVRQATGEREVTAIGYCIGGTLLSAALAYMASKRDRRIRAVTFFAAQVDFSEAGDLRVFIDDKQLARLDRRMGDTGGYLDADDMFTAFNMLRANDLIWSFYVDNYLLGKDPPRFDLLYWNSDATRMPRALHSYYLREMYLENNLARPNGITLDGVPIDLRKVKIPVYLQASKEDHIAPYPSVFKAKRLFSGPVRFVLAGSGHIAGVINPPAAKKYNHWLNEAQPDDLDEWIATAESHPGSWWDDWDAWLSRHSGSKVPARIPGDGKLEPIEDAPGSYVRK